MEHVLDEIINVKSNILIIYETLDSYVKENKTMNQKDKKFILDQKIMIKNQFDILTDLVNHDCFENCEFDNNDEDNNDEDNNNDEYSDDENNEKDYNVDELDESDIDDKY